MTDVKYNQEDLFDHHAVGAVIKNQKEEVLMQDHIKYGFWTIPVGKVKDGQSIEAALKEEVFEECNISTEKSVETAIKDCTYNRGGSLVKVRIHLFEILKFEGEVKNNEPNKHREQIFLPLNKIKKIPYLSDTTLLYLETLGIKRKAKIL